MRPSKVISVIIHRIYSYVPDNPSLPLNVIIQVDLRFIPNARHLGCQLKVSIIIVYWQNKVREKKVFFIY